MKLFVVAIVLTAGHLAAARDPKELAYNDHIQKSGKPLPGAYQSIDDTVGVWMNKDMTEAGKEASQEYIPLYDKLDKCFEDNNGPCIEQIFEKFHKLDKVLTASLKTPALKKAYEKFTENMFRAGEQAAQSAEKTGKVDIVKLDAAHKKENDAFYKLLR